MAYSQTGHDDSSHALPVGVPSVCDTQRRRLSQNGFSLLEILVSLLIFTVLAKVAAPSVATITRIYTLRAAAREVYSDVQNARASAVMSGHRYRVILVNTHQYQLHDDRNNNGIVDTGETVLTRDIATDAPTVTLSGTSPITFLSDGTVLAAATITITQPNVTKFKTATLVIANGGRLRLDLPTS